MCIVYRELRYLRKQRRKVEKRLKKDREAHKEAGEITRQEHLFDLKVCVCNVCFHHVCVLWVCEGVLEG